MDEIFDEQAEWIMDEAQRWQAVLERDATQDGAFVYAIRSTGIYCRPSCASRKPRRQNVLFFALPGIARQAGFRACKRCQPDLAAQPDSRLDLVMKICDYIQSHLGESLTLQALSDQFALSQHHLQRQFKQVVGISPLQYAEACRMDQLKMALRRGSQVSAAVYEAGFSSPSRVYSRAAAQLGMTPGEFQQAGRGQVIRYTTVTCHLGTLLVAATERGICAVRLGDAPAALEASLQEEFGQAELLPADPTLQEWVEVILRYIAGNEPDLHLPLDVQATAFRKQVWQAIQQIPYGATRTYQQVANMIGRPTAVRAVARACATNPAALVVPCHRVVRSDGGLGGYRWGVERKEKLLQTEGAAALRSSKKVG